MSRLDEFHFGLPISQSLFDHIPVGVGSKGIIPMGARDLEEALEMGMDWSLREGYAWAEDKVNNIIGANLQIYNWTLWIKECLPIGHYIPMLLYGHIYIGTAWLHIKSIL